MNHPTLFLLPFLFFSVALAGQSVPFSSPRWTVTAERSEVVTFGGRESLLLHNGSAVLEDVAFLDGVIEFDLFMNGERAFPGCFFRMQDELNYEEFYVRPHQSGNPDANQYTPVFNGVPAWQLYHGPAYGKAYQYPVGRWMHVRLVVSGGQGEVYFDGEAEPALVIPNLMQAHKAGPIGLKAAPVPVYFSNFSFSLSPPSLRGKAEAVSAKTPEGIIREWEVSPVFAEQKLEGKATLSASDKPAGEWTKLAAEATGITNLARVRRLTDEANTVFVRLTIDAEEEGLRRLDFGYSDRVRVYCNDRLLYAGDNGFRTRDYRYLGTIGLFDGVFLPLQKGRNEILLAVSESFGGWGVMGRLE